MSTTKLTLKAQCVCGAVILEGQEIVIIKDAVASTWRVREGHITQQWIGNRKGKTSQAMHRSCWLDFMRLAEQLAAEATRAREIARIMECGEGEV